uniref:Serine/threonine-protein phosphatase 7 long form homolog n=1 Tax=Nicotiana tabacum TaxID=4097 RepID=A0A1S3YTL7_TOBAC|nr:PREDICTED: serine/threonine-protein phosphatase 7 long form homolog [Nicotiana tabacum]
MGLYRIISIGGIQLDYTLITALIERWRPETHTFHLPIGEATITLQDVEILYGLSTDGLPGLLPGNMRYFNRAAYMDMLHRLTGFRSEDPDVAIGSSRMQLVSIRDHLVQIHDTITDDSAEVDVEQYTRLLLLLLFGGVLFPNTSGNLVSLRFLHHIADFDDTVSYSWGGAVLSFLYRQMCRASMGTQRDVSGFLPLLQRPLGANPRYYHRRLSGGGCGAIYEAVVAPSIWGGLVPEHFGEPSEPSFSASYCGL